MEGEEERLYNSLNTALRRFIQSHRCTPAPARPNTTVTFQVVDTTVPPLTDSPSPLNITAFEQLLDLYPGNLKFLLPQILRYGALIGYTGPDVHRLSKNLQTANLLPDVMDTNIAKDLALNRIHEINPAEYKHLISSPLGFAPKSDGTWRKIQHFSFPHGESVNGYIREESASLQYASFDQILAMVLAAGLNCVLVKRDMADAFRNLVVALRDRWLLAFEWKGKYYVDRVLPFGLSTSPFIFNLLAEAWHWILQSWLHIEHIEHFLDDTMMAIPVVHASPESLQLLSDKYKELSYVTGIPGKDEKDAMGTKVELLGRLVDTTTFTASVPPAKIAKILELTAQALHRGSLTLWEAQSLTGLLSFCSPCVQNGVIFCRRLWTFIASFKAEWQKTLRRRLPRLVLDDIQWWHELFPTYNGVRFFDDINRQFVHIFADASIHGLGAFFFDHVDSLDCRWQDHSSILPLRHALAEPLPPFDVGIPFDINIYEIQAVLRAFELWGHLWRSKHVVVHTDNSTTQIGVQRLTLKSPEQNEPLRKLLLLAAQHDVKLTSVHLPGDDNGLADALSRNLPAYVASCCPQWIGSMSNHQLSATLTLRPALGVTLQPQA